MSDDKKPKNVSVVYGYTRRPDGSIEFHEGVPEDFKRQILEEHSASLTYEAQRRMLWGEIGPGSMTRLAKMFVQSWQLTTALKD